MMNFQVTYHHISTLPEGVLIKCVSACIIKRKYNLFNTLPMGTHYIYIIHYDIPCNIASEQHLCISLFMLKIYKMIICSQIKWHLKIIPK